MEIREEFSESVLKKVSIKTGNVIQMPACSLNTEIDTSAIKFKNYFIESMYNTINEVKIDDEINSEILTFECDIPDVKDEYIEPTDCFNESSTSRTISQKILEKNKNRIKKRAKPKGKRYSCPVCQKGITSSARKSHFEAHFLNKPVICIFCGKLFVQRKLYTSHYISHYVKIRKIVKANSDVASKPPTAIDLTATFRQYECKICSKRYDSLNSFNVHMPHHAGASQTQCLKILLFKGNTQTPPIPTEAVEKSLTCTICFKKFPTDQTLKIHIDSHTASKCDNSLTTFLVSPNLKWYTPLATEVKRFKCTICSKDFNQRYFKKHMQKHTGEKPYKCTLCPKIFTNSRLLKVHMFSHTREKLFTCKICLKTLKTESSLKNHMYIHTEEKRFKCDVCSKGFITNRQLKVHMLRHTGEKPFDCNICLKGFATKCCLKMHVRKHTGENSLECDVCLKKYPTNHHLTIHKRSHTGERPFECKICGKGFISNNYLKYHVKVHTDEKPFECDVCSERFVTKRILNAHHVRTHTIKKSIECEICSKKVASRRYLKIHLRRHTERKQLKCEVCCKDLTTPYSLNVHMRLHNGEKPFECEKCSNRFASLRSLNNHARCHKRKI